MPRGRGADDRARYEVQLRESAHEDLERIYEYIAETHPLNAARYVDRIHRALESLSLLPRAHREPPGLGGLGVRQVIVGAHRALFFVREDLRRVDVVRIVHVRQDAESYEADLREALG